MLQHMSDFEKLDIDNLYFRVQVLKRSCRYLQGVRQHPCAASPVLRTAKHDLREALLLMARV